MSFDLNKEKLLRFILMEDQFAKRISVTAGPAYWRAFILEDRETHEIFALMRFKYEDGNRSWYRLGPPPKETRDATIENLRSGIIKVQRIALTAFGLTPEELESAIQCIDVPDDGGDGMKTVCWLEQQDLIETKVVLKGNHDQDIDA